MSSQTRYIAISVLAFLLGVLIAALLIHFGYGM